MKVLYLLILIIALAAGFKTTVSSKNLPEETPFGLSLGDSAVVYHDPEPNIPIP